MTTKYGQKYRPGGVYTLESLLGCGLTIRWERVFTKCRKIIMISSNYRNDNGSGVFPVSWRKVGTGGGKTFPKVLTFKRLKLSGDLNGVLIDERVVGDVNLLRASKFDRGQHMWQCLETMEAHAQELDECDKAEENDENQTWKWYECFCIFNN